MYNPFATANSSCGLPVEVTNELVQWNCTHLSKYALFHTNSDTKTQPVCSVNSSHHPAKPKVFCGSTCKPGLPCRPFAAPVSLPSKLVDTSPITSIHHPAQPYSNLQLTRVSCIGTLPASSVSHHFYTQLNASNSEITAKLPCLSPLARLRCASTQRLHACRHCEPP